MKVRCYIKCLGCLVRNARCNTMSHLTADASCFVQVSRETPDVTPCHTSPPQGVGGNATPSPRETPTLDPPPVRNAGRNRFGSIRFGSVIFENNYCFGSVWFGNCFVFRFDAVWPALFECVMVRPVRFGLLLLPGTKIHDAPLGQAAPHRQRARQNAGGDHQEAGGPQ